jgi:aldose 1-epimerase
MTTHRVNFGALADGSAVEAVDLSNAQGLSARIMTLGASIQSLSVPDRNGELADIVLGHATAAEYLAKPQYFGATVGRYANRIAKGRFALGNTRYALETNDGPNHLHGGHRGFDKRLWKMESVSNERVALSLVSPDGEGGYPGALKVMATFTLNDRNELVIEYRATTDKATIVNISGHSYFNLAGEASATDVLDHRVTLNADAFTPVDETLIPTGERRRVESTPFDFRTPTRIGRMIRDGRDEQIRLARGYDHNFILRDADGTLREAALVEEPKSGRVLEVLTTAPGIQFYSGNFLDGTSVGKSGRVYRQGDGLCLEPQTFPDSPNRADFPSARLDPGKEYVNTIVYRFSVTR